MLISNRRLSSTYVSVGEDQATRAVQSNGQLTGAGSNGTSCYASTEAVRTLSHASLTSIRIRCVEISTLFDAAERCYVCVCTYSRQQQSQQHRARATTGQPGSRDEAI
jgi:hypothetical protein